MADLIDYRMEIVGGPFDGAAGMRWRDDGGHAPPQVVLLGLCRGDGSCASFAEDECRRRKREHPYFWLPVEETRPAKTVTYELQDSFIEPQEATSMRIVPGRAIYVIGGLLLPGGGELREEVDLDLDAEWAGVGELVPAGMSASVNCRCMVIDLEELR